MRLQAIEKGPYRRFSGNDDWVPGCERQCCTVVKIVVVLEQVPSIDRHVRVFHNELGLRRCKLCHDVPQIGLQTDWIATGLVHAVVPRYHVGGLAPKIGQTKTVGKRGTTSAGPKEAKEQ